MLARCIGVHPELRPHTARLGLELEFPSPGPTAGRNQVAHCRIGIDRTDQACPDIGHRVTGLGRVGHRDVVDLHLVGIAQLGGKRDHVNLIGRTAAPNINHVVASSHLGLLHVDKRRTVRIVTEGDAVGAVSKVDHKVLGRRRLCHLIGQPTAYQPHHPLVALRIVTLPVNTGTVSVAIAKPRDHKAAVLQRGNRWMVLRTRDIGVHQELISHRGPIGIVALSKHILTAATTTAAVTVVITPCHHKASSFKATHRRLILMASRIGVHPELTRDLRPVRIKGTRPYIITAASPCPIIVTALVIAPRHHKSATTQRRHRRLILVARELVRVDTELLNRLRPVGIHDPRPHIITTAGPCPVIVTALVIAPCHHKSAILKARNRRPVLVARLLGLVHPKLSNRLHPVRVKDPRPHVVTAAAVMAASAVITPRHHKSAALDARCHRLVLVA